ncbi:MAG: hypothetical protein C4527_14800 [Candidatus Omnitrophota bacterium]|jgi:hypothetical protein|nr:MAG: hypothetical protein C4527_14800 [Candidatus Omnitrophota bacterium]
MTVIVVLVLLCGQMKPSVDGVNVPITLDRDIVRIHSFFHGETVKLYGTIPTEIDGVIAILRSDRSERRHDRPLLCQISTKDQPALFRFRKTRYRVHNFPALFLLASNRPLTDLIHENENTQPNHLPVGYASLREEWDKELISGVPSKDDGDVLFDTLIRWKEKQGLFGLNEEKLELKDNGHFLYSFFLPPAVEEGNYTLTAHVIKDHNMIGTGHASLSVESIGVIHFLRNLSVNHPLLYGCVSVLTALSVGVLVSFIFRRKSGR